DRRVEPGQTVAASFNTPVLFVIARDLTQMRVLAEIDEADVGKVAADMAVDVVVDAFPDHHFVGKLTQIRYSPTTVEGVVTYAAGHRGNTSRARRARGAQCGAALRAARQGAPWTEAWCRAQRGAAHRRGACSPRAARSRPRGRPSAARRSARRSQGRATRHRP